MKKIAAAAVIAAIFSSCGFFKENILIKDVLKRKEIIEKTDNPAKKHFLKLDLANKIIILENVLVKDVTTSTNIDYSFCIVVDLKIDGKMIECYIYSDNIRKIARLQKGKSKINAKGEFYRFFAALDDYDTKIEIVKSKIEILDNEMTKDSTDSKPKNQKNTMKKTEKKDSSKKNTVK